MLRMDLNYKGNALSITLPNPKLQNFKYKLLQIPLSFIITDNLLENVYLISYF